MDVSVLKSAVRDIPNFPKEGILFKDITPLLQNYATFSATIDALAEAMENDRLDIIVGIESRGFIFSPALAYKLKTGLVPVRKKGKLPAETHQVAYELEYGNAVLEIHKDAIKPGARVAIVDDLLATGGTAEAAARLVSDLGGKVVRISCVVELEFLKGRERLKDFEVYSLLRY